ncbi:50S ribosomal protein L18 [Candidatus Bathyarchaeota archaeon]|nr:50S ribosomal protein L18 [Candidatus Bathyarchaeota archaeon]
MGKGATYNVPYRRRREGKTNYSLRKKLVSSGLPRIVVRKTGKYIIAQLVEPNVKGDRVITSAHSSELRKKYGYLGSLNCLPSSYLTGLLCGYKSVACNIKEAVLDIGLQIPSKGANVFAVAKGFLDAGVKVPFNEEVAPDDKRIMGTHIAAFAEKLSSNLEEYKRFFSSYNKRGLAPEKISEHFAMIKEKIVSNFNKSSKKQ